MNTSTTPTSVANTSASAMPRMAGWLVFAIVLSLLVMLLAPQQLPVSLYKLSLVSLAAVVGYWIDRSLFPYARPDYFLNLYSIQREAAQKEEEEDRANNQEPAYFIGTHVDGSLLQAANSAMLRRAVIVAATMLAVGLGA